MKSEIYYRFRFSYQLFSKLQYCTALTALKGSRLNFLFIMNNTNTDFLENLRDLMEEPAIYGDCDLDENKGMFPYRLLPK